MGRQAFGGGAFGWDLAVGGLAVAHHAALGGFAYARDLAVGGEATATHVNDALAREELQTTYFFYLQMWIVQHPVQFTMTVFALSMASVCLLPLLFRRRSRTPSATLPLQP